MAQRRCSFKPATPLAWAFWLVATGQQVQDRPAKSTFAHAAPGAEYFSGDYLSHEEAAAAAQRDNGGAAVVTCEFHPRLASELIDADDLLDSANERAVEHSEFFDAVPAIDPNDDELAALNSALGLLFDGWSAFAGHGCNDWTAAPGEVVEHKERVSHE